MNNKLMTNIKSKFKGSGNRKVENLVFFLVLLIVTMLIINAIWKGDNKKDETNTINNTKVLASSENKNNASNSSNTERTMQEELENILSKISGVGKVNVLLTYSQTSTQIPVYNEQNTQNDTEESDTSGGTRKVQEVDSKKEVIYEEIDGEKTIVTQSIVNPEIKGAIITAEGASSAEVKEIIIQAVEAATGLAVHKIQVFEME